MKAVHLFDSESEPGVWHEAGRVVDHPDAFRLVQLGTCRPADEECQEAAGLTEAEWQHRVAAYVHMHGTRPEQVDELGLDPQLTEVVRSYLAAKYNIVEEIQKAKGVEDDE